MTGNIRRRAPRHRTPAAPDETQPKPESSPTDAIVEQLDDTADKAHEGATSYEKGKGRKHRHTLIFLLGSLFGLVAAGLFAKSNDLIVFPELGELSMDSFLDVIPAGLVTDLRDLMVGPCLCL